jgi:putative SOS response-associated peptidase YedK
MCGRYVSRQKPEDIAAEFGIAQLALAERLEPDYNVAPTKPVYAVLERAERQLRVLTWGLVPSWAKDRAIGSRLINARVESVTEKPAYRRAFAKRRCILPADGYYEWYKPESGPKQPFFLHPRTGIMAMAGLYELWRAPDRDRDDPDAWLWTTVVLTGAATPELSAIHDRMPLIVRPEAYDRWLAPEPLGDDELDALLTAPGGDGGVITDPVSTAVNSARNNGPELIDPIPTEPATTAPSSSAPIESMPTEPENDGTLF